MNLQQTEVDNSNLETFNNTRYNADSLRGVNKRGTITGYVINDSVGNKGYVMNNETPAEVEVSDAPVSVEVEPEPEVEAEETESTQEEENSPFASQFESTFGIKPNEAIELVNNLQAFRDEQTLMRHWQVDPTAYDERMKKVKEFYNTLPEDGREQFNTVEGATVIWEHLQKTGVVKPPQETNSSSRRSRVSRDDSDFGERSPRSRLSRQPQKPAYDYTRADILSMSDAEYKKQLPKITEAYRNGRVKE